MHISRLLPAAAILLALTACAGPAATPSVSPSAPVTPATASPSPSASPSPGLPSSSTAPAQANLDGIKVAGKKGKAPTLTFTKPFVVDKTITKVLVQGTGNAAVADGLVTINYVGTNGRDGKVFDSSFSRKAPVTFPLANVITGFKTGLTGQKVGSRVLIGIPSSEGYGDNGSSDGSIKAGDTIIFVVDILAASADAPAGKTVTPPAGLPSVSGTATEKPTVTMPGTSAPTTMAAQTLIEGTGAKVAKTDTIYARFVGYSWKTGKLIHDQWTPLSGALSSTIPGWQSGLLGKTVGSRVLLVLPPADGYPDGATTPPLEKGDTIVYVVDLLYAYSAG